MSEQQNIGASGFSTYEILDTFLADITDADGNTGLQVSFLVPGATPVGFRLTPTQVSNLTTALAAWLVERENNDD